MSGLAPELVLLRLFQIGLFPLGLGPLVQLALGLKFLLEKVGLRQGGVDAPRSSMRSPPITSVRPGICPSSARHWRR